MKLVKILIYLYLLVFAIEPICAFAHFPFKQYRVEDGLSHNTVWCGLQDRYGFIWFGTSDGLNRYDGRGNKVYRNVLSEDFSLENNFIETLLEEGQNIWIGTSSGIYIYDYVTDRFSRFDKTTDYGVLISSEVKKIVKAKDGKLWIATLGQGFFVYDPQKNSLIQNSMFTSFFWDICVGEDGKIYMVSLQEGLLCFDEEGNLLQTYKMLDEEDSKHPDGHKINCVQCIEGDIWVGADVNRVYRLNKRQGRLDIFSSAMNLGAVRCMVKYTENKLLLGTDNGLYVFDCIEKTFQRADDPLSTRTLSDLTINAMMWDAEGTLWVMTNLGGVNYMPKETKNFAFYSPATLPGVSTIGKVIGPFYENAEGNIWIGTRNGLCYFDARTEQLSEYYLGGDKKLKPDIRSLMLDGDDLWIGTYGDGLYVLELKSGKIKKYAHSRGVPNSICSDEVLCVYKDRKGNILIGTSWGLCQYSPKNDDFLTMTTIGSMTSVTDIAEDMHGNIWIATSNSGVFRYETETQRWKHFTHNRKDTTTITSNSVICLFKDMQGTMWFGTNGGGLCSFNPKEESFVNFDPHNTVLPNNVIYSIEQDMAGNFWISSNIGLIEINPMAKGSYRRFTVNDGLQGNQFTVQSSLRTSDGKFYFGGINGFNVFAPEQFKDNAWLPPVYITDISFPSLTDGREVKQLLNLKKPLYMTDQIVLPFKYNSFTLRFVALSYEDPLKNRYSYMLKGVDKEWVIAPEGSNRVSYTNLSPGEYEFLLRGSNNDDKWNERITTLKIVVTPPWWLSTVAYVVYVILLLLLTFFIGWRWNLHVKKKYRRRMDDYRTNQEKEVYKSKINFFVNLVHEIRTPLTLIQLPLEKMLEANREGKDREYLTMMDKNVGYLLSVTNQLLDFQKMESGALQLSKKECLINELIEDVYNQFTGVATLKGLELNRVLPEENLFAMIDREKISKILVNLTGNALKYAKNRIVLTLSANEKILEIIVSNDGPRIPAEEKDRIFEAFYQLPGDKKASTGTGIGLAFAKSLAEAHHGDLRVEDAVEGGAAFILSLPLEKAELISADDELVDNEKTEDSEESIVASKSAEQKYTVLLVEDNVDLLNITQTSLSVWYRVLKACNGKEALAVLANENVDIIVSDVMMPEMNGLELCNMVKTTIEYSHIPLILLTAKTTLEAKLEGLECGADAYVEKPFLVKQLHMQIENLFKLRQHFYELMSEPKDSEKMEEMMPRRDYEFLMKVQEAVVGQLADENLSIETIAEQVNMSRSNFYRKIKALLGMSPNDYLKMIRLQRASELIKEGLSISEVAERVGFTSSSYFAKCFKAQYGVLPKDYLTQLQSEKSGQS